MEPKRLPSSAGRCRFGKSVVMVMVVILQVIKLSSSTPGSTGREFTFAFPPNYIQDGRQCKIGVIIQTTSAINATKVNISIPLGGRNYSVTLDPSSPPHQVELPSDLINAMISGLTQSAVLVTADQDITLVAYNYKDYTMDLFTVLPRHHLGKEYFVATFTQPSGGAIIITALAEPVFIEVTPNAVVEFRGLSYERGDAIRHELLPYQTMQLEPMLISIVGTRIIANSTIAVTVGCLCAYVPADVERCDHLAEQLTPFDQWGRSFLLSPFINRLSGYLYQVVAGRNDTRVLIEDYEIQLNMGEYYLADVRGQTMSSIKSNKPIMIMQYSKGTDSDMMIGDPAMVIVPPWEQYSSRVQFPVFNFSAAGITTVYVSLTLECNTTDAIRFNNLRYDQINWLIEYDIVTQDGRYMCTLWMAVEGGSHVLTGQTPGAADDTLFTSLVYGIGRRISYLYNPGFNLEKLTCTAPSTTSSAVDVEVTCDSLRSRFCLECTTNSSSGLISWSRTDPNTEALSDVLCTFNTLRAGLPVARRMCLNHPRTGAYWSTISFMDCGQRDSPITAGELAEVVVDASNVKAVSGILEEVTSNLAEIDDDVVQSISKILENIVTVGSPSPEVTTSVGKAVNNLVGSLGASESTSGQLAESSSTVVRSLEQQVSLTLQDSGEFNLAEPNVVIQATTVDALAMGDGIAFNGGKSEYNSPRASIKLPSSVFTIGDGKAGATSSGKQVRFIMFNGAALFRSPDTTRTSGNVISAAVEGTRVQGLSDPVQISFDALEALGENATLSNLTKCVYWDFQLRKGVGDWSSQGCSLGDVSGGVVTCACDHLTNFAVLMDISGQHQGAKTKFHLALDILSKVGCAISIIALTITIVVFLVFKRLRASRPRRILLHFCVSLISLYLVFLLGIDHASGSDRACIAVGALIHYFTLSTMLWMAAEALNMYLLIVRVFDEEGPCFLTKSAIIAWGAPLVVVGITVGLRTDDYLHKSYCFLTPGLSFFIGVLLPIGLILSFNFIIFLIVIRRLWTANLGGTVPLEKEDKAARYRQLKTRLLNAFSISVLLGLTWVFGFLAIEDATFVFQLVFCLVNSLQGLVVFILFCVRQEDVRKSMAPHYRRLAGMLPHTGRPSTITAYSLTSRSTSRNDNDNVARNPLRTMPISTGTYLSNNSSHGDGVRMVSTTNDAHEYHDEVIDAGLDGENQTNANYAAIQ